MPVVGTLGFVRWAEPSSPGDTCLYPVRVTSVLASGKFHCEFIGCGGQRTTEPLPAISLLAGDDDGYTGLGSTNAATPAPSAQRRDDPAAANSALALPSGEPRNWRVGGEDGAEEGACTLTPGKRCCVVKGPIGMLALRATGDAVVKRIRVASKVVGCPVHIRSSTNGRYAGDELRIHLKCCHGATPRAPDRLSDVTPGTVLPPKLVSAAVSAEPQSTDWHAVVSGRATDVTAQAVADLGLAACSLMEDHAGAGPAAAAAADCSTIPSVLHDACAAVNAIAAFSKM